MHNNAVSQIEGFAGKRNLRSRRRNLGVALVLLAFTALGIARHLHMYGEDLASSYVGCRLLAAGEGDHLYSRSAVNFSKVADPVWDDMARRTGYQMIVLLHPYVQTPLWAYSLEPVCTRMDFRHFCDWYMIFFMLSTSGTIWLVARYWTPALFHPGWIVLVYFCFYRSEPFKYAIFLSQTHILYLFMTVLALILAERRRPVGAGVLLALAAAVKITPGFLLLYWLLTRRYKAAFWFVASSVVLVALTFLLLGSGMMHAYLQSLSQNSNVLLLAFNNQSFPAWLVGLRSPKTEALHWYIHQMPVGVKVLSLSLGVTSTIAGGWLDRRTEKVGRPDERVREPYGAVFAMLGATIFAPIAWTHYFILLVIPVMMFLQKGRQRRSWGWIAVILFIFLLNLYPISFGSVHFRYKSFTIVRSQFYSGVLAMLGLAVLGYEKQRRELSLPPATVLPSQP